MFQFSRFPVTKELHLHATAGLLQWVSPFGHPRIKAYLAAPRGLSQPATSFVGHIFLGIPRMHFRTNYHSLYHLPFLPEGRLGGR